MSRCAADIERVSGVSHQETVTLRRNTTGAPPESFAILPLEPETVEWIVRRILPRVGIHHRVWHVCIEKEGTLQFAAFDNFEFPFVGDAVPEVLLKDLVERGVLKSYRGAENGAVVLAEG